VSNNLEKANIVSLIAQNRSLQNAMQSSVLAKNGTGEEEGTIRFDAIREQIAIIAQNNRIEIQKFKFSTDRIENGIAIDFALRLVVLSNENGDDDCTED
jgi:hypothetical protein